MKRFLCLGSVVVLFVICTGCGDTFRPIIIPNPPQFPNPQAAHSVLTINQNGTVSSGQEIPQIGTAMAIDVSGDTDSGWENVGVVPVHAVQQSASTVLVVNQSDSAQPQDSVSKVTFSGTTISTVSTISLPQSYDASGNLVSAVPNFVATTESANAYVLMPQYQPPNQSGKGGVIVPSVAVINATTGGNPQTLSVGNNPIAMAETPDGTKLYVANQGDSTISAFNTQDRSARQICVNGSCPTGNTPLKLASTPIWISARSDNDRMYVLEQNGTIAYMDTSTTGGPDNLYETYSPQTVQAPGASYMVYDMILNRVYVPFTNQLAIIDASQNTPVLLQNISVPQIPGLPSPVSATAVAVAALPDGSRAYVASIPASAQSSQVTISAVEGSGNTATYTYTWTGGHDLTPGILVTVTGTSGVGGGAFDGTFTIGAVSGTNCSQAAQMCTFQVPNDTTLAQTAVTASASSVIDNLFPQVTVVTTASNTIETTTGMPGFPDATDISSPYYVPACAAARFRWGMAGGGSSARAYFSACDAGAVDIIETSSDTYYVNLQEPVSARSPIPPAQLNPPQNPVFMIAGP